MKLIKGMWLSFVTVTITVVFSMCSNDNLDKSSTPKLPDNPIVILYENDVHCAVDGYAKLADLGQGCQGV